ncbi:MAG: NAD(P)-dependent alcohol dehydrogenase [Beijerinckiaceae bacterium]
MRAFILPKPDGIDALQQVERPVPKPGRGQILVKVHACSLNYRDYAIASGSYRAGSKPDLIPLSDGAGEVVETGPDVTKFKTGDRVASCFFQRWTGGEAGPQAPGSALGGAIDGMLADYAVLEEEGAVAVPDHLSFEEAASLPCAAVTAWHALVDHGGLAAGKTILIQGTGGVSVFALQIARMFGAAVIGTSSSDAKLARIAEMGAAHGINYRTIPDWEKAALELTGGRGVDQVVEVGGAGTFAKSIAAIRPGGKVSMIGVLSRQAEINPMIIMAKRANVQGISVGSTRMFEALNAALAVNKVKPVIDRTFAFSETKAAYEYLKSAAHFGKIIIRMD